MKQKDIVGKAMNALGISTGMKTNPNVIRDVLSEMRLEDFQTRYAPMEKFLREATLKEQSLGPMLRCVRDALLYKHPAIVAFAKMALRRKWLRPSKRVVWAVHTGFLLEAFTSAMCNSRTFFLEVQNHYRKKGKRYGIDFKNFFRTFYTGVKTSHSIFETIKAFSVDPGMVYFRTGKGLGKKQCSLHEIENNYKKKRINFIEKRLLMPVKKGLTDHVNRMIQVNIYEAGVTEFLHNFLENAECAEALCEDMEKRQFEECIVSRAVLPRHHRAKFYESVAHTQHFFPLMKFSRDWVRLYITWNAAFVLGNIDDIDILLPNLFIPSMIDGDAYNFLGVRIVSLWLSIWHNFFRCYDGKSHPLMKEGTRRAMGEAWGNLNRRYAENLMQHGLKESPSTLSNISKKFYAHPFWNLARKALFLWI